MAESNEFSTASSNTNTQTINGLPGSSQCFSSVDGVCTAPLLIMYIPTISLLGEVLYRILRHEAGGICSPLPKQSQDLVSCLSGYVISGMTPPYPISMFGTIDNLFYRQHRDIGTLLAPKNYQILREFFIAYSSKKHPLLFFTFSYVSQFTPPLLSGDQNNLDRLITNDVIRYNAFRGLTCGCFHLRQCRDNGSLTGLDTAYSLQQYFSAMALFYTQVAPLYIERHLDDDGYPIPWGKIKQADNAAKEKLGITDLSGVTAYDILTRALPERYRFRVGAPNFKKKPQIQEISPLHFYLDPPPAPIDREVKTYFLEGPLRRKPYRDS